MATKRQILAKATQLGVDLSNPAKVSLLLTCVSGAILFASLPKAIKKCAKKLGML